MDLKHVTEILVLKRFYNCLVKLKNYSSKKKFLAEVNIVVVV